MVTTTTRRTTLLPRVLVAMSGGVDSSVAAALLVRQGYAVTGGYMKNFSPESWAGVVPADCPWEADLRDVAAVCRTLGISYQCFNFEAEYRRRVIDYFFAEYARGRTPNPDLRCNREIKFDLFLERARALGFDAIATGHYAQVIGGRLYQGVDKNKDQSYFLSSLNARQLTHAILPLGGYHKAAVRAYARSLGLPNADKPDSQGICFVGRVKLQTFLAQRLAPRWGRIVDTRGRTVGRHPGAWFFTLGQRHGLGLGGGSRWYVTGLDVEKNQLTVAAGHHHPRLHRRSFPITHLHWVNAPRPLPLHCTVSVRYRQDEKPGVVLRRGRRLVVNLRQPQFAITPGQAAVFYRGGEVLGSATVSRW